MPPHPEQVVKDQLYAQQHWANQVYSQVRKGLIENVPLRNKVRLQCESHQQTGAWLSVAPNPNLGFQFSKGEYLLLRHSRLPSEITPSPAAAAGTPPPLQQIRTTPGCVRRPPGLVPQSWLVETPQWLLHRTHRYRSKRRASIAHRGPSTRPATSGGSAHLQLPCLNPSRPWDPNLAAVDKAEAAKHLKSDAPRTAAGLDFIPVGADTFGAYGHEGEQFLGQLFSRYAKRHSSDRVTSYTGQLQQECWQRVAVALRNAVAQQLSSAYSQTGGAWAPPFFGDAPQAPSG